MGTLFQLAVNELNETEVAAVAVGVAGFSVTVKEPLKVEPSSNIMPPEVAVLLQVIVIDVLEEVTFVPLLTCHIGLATATPFHV